MTGVETSADLLEFLQADHAGKITSKKIASLQQWRMMQNLSSYLEDCWVSSPFFLLFKIVMPEQNLQSWFEGHMSTSSSGCRLSD